MFDEKDLEKYAKEVQKGNPLTEDFLPKSKDIKNNALLARDLSEEALAQQIMKNTGVPIPNKNASASKIEDALNRIASEHYPELKNPNIRLGDTSEMIDGIAKVNKNTNPSFREKLSTALHEVGHKFDDEVLKQGSKEVDFNLLKKLKNSSFDLKGADPMQVYEKIAKGHHAEIPNLREGTFGRGALTSLLKSGKFRQLIPFIGPALALGSVAASGDVSAAIPIVNEIDSLGPKQGSPEALLEDPRTTNEERQKALQQIRKQALNKELGE